MVETSSWIKFCQQFLMKYLCGNKETQEIDIALKNKHGDTIEVYARFSWTKSSDELHLLDLLSFQLPSVKTIDGESG
jgi:hypothetical protein